MLGILGNLVRVAVNLSGRRNSSSSFCQLR